MVACEMCERACGTKTDPQNEGPACIDVVHVWAYLPICTKMQKVGLLAHVRKQGVDTV